MTTADAACANIGVPMSQTIAPLPQHTPGGEPGMSAAARAIAWAVLLGLAFWPRLWIIGFWIFGRQLGDAFSSWIIPAIGFVILPWTTLIYAFMWGITSNVVSGWEWVAVGAAFIVDILFWIWSRSSIRG
jgi:hypothetical protein